MAQSRRWGKWKEFGCGGSRGGKEGFGRQDTLIED